MQVCRVCDSDNLEQFLDLGNQAYCNNFPVSADKLEPIYPLRVWYCYDCTAVQLDYTVPKETMFAKEYLYVSGTTKTMRDHFQSTANKLTEKLGLEAGDLVVDIGSNDGTWLSYYPDGVQVLGIEPAENISALANESGVRTLNSFFNLETAQAIHRDFGYPKLITAAGVFLHLEELHSVVDGIKFLLEGGASFYLQSMYIGEMLENTEFDVIYHEHLNYWSLRSLSALFERHGLEINEVAPIDIHGGSIELIVSLAGTKDIDVSVADCLSREWQAGLNNISTYRDFAARVSQIGYRLTDILAKFKALNKSVYAFGAPAKGATLLNSFGIGSDLVALAVERNQLKVGRCISGTDIRIVDESVAPIPDAYLILPWNFLPEFLNKKLDYIISGGSFIVPIPNPVVIDATNYTQYVTD